MSSTPRSSKPSKPSKTEGKLPPVEEPVQPGWLDRAANFWLNFGRFGWDILGIGLLAVALLTLLGLIDITQGLFINPWVDFLRRWLGWGSYIVSITLVLLGLLAIRHHSDQPLHFHLSRVLALESAAFTLLALVTAISGTSIDRALKGMDGGLIGWGLARLVELVLPSPLSIGLLVLVLALCLIVGTGLFARFVGWVERQAALEVPDRLPVTSSLPVISEEEERAAPSSTRKATRDPEPVEEDLPVLPSTRDRRLPPLNLLMKEQPQRPDEAQIHQSAAQLEQTLAEFGVPARVTGYRIGPTVTQYAVEPGFIEKTGPEGEVVRQKVRVSQISALARDLALALSAERLRIEAPVPGQSFVGIEVPNSRSTIVRLRPILESDPFHKLNSQLGIALGQDVSGQPVVADLGRMPHILIAGTTGSGKSVCIAALTACLVMNNTPNELKLAMLDPKMVELVRFNGLPHLMGKVETSIERMLAVLRWALVEMDNRYRLLENARARDLAAYNAKMARRGQPTLPRIVLLIDELADLMMTAPDQTEHSLVRLAQMARATGMHLVVATQRPSTDVVTGLIKANFPARLSFTVASSIDSRVILDSNGAETLLGRGDMLFLNPESGTPQRAQGVYVTDLEVEKVVNFWRKMAPPDMTEAAPWEEMVSVGDDGDSDALIEQATKIVRQSQRASASMLQRRLRIGYPRAARLIDELEELGVIGPGQGGGREREVLLPPEDGDEDDVSDDQEE